MKGKDESQHVDVKLQVRYAETDQMGHAYYANYLVWFEVGRAAYCRARGLTYSKLEEDDNIFLPVVHAGCRYMRPLRYDEEFIVRTRVGELRSRVLTFCYEIMSVDEGTSYAEGETTHVFTDDQVRPRRLPQAYRELLDG